MPGNQTFKYPIYLRSLLCIILFVLCAGYLNAQHDPYEVLFNGIISAESEPGVPLTSEELFLAPLASEGSLFDDVTRYGLSFVRYSRRGIRSSDRSFSVLGADLSGNLNSGTDYGVWNAFRRLQLEELTGNGAVWFSGRSAMQGRSSYGLNPDVVRDRKSVGTFVTDRKGRMGVKASASGTVKEKWIYMADVYRRWGRDATVKGVFTDRTAWSTAVSRSFMEKHRLTLVSAGEAGEDGLRSYVAREVIELTGDNYYNPSWGYQDGRKRNGRVSKGLIPFTALSYEGIINEKISVAATVSYRGGKEAVSGLTWLDAATPYPDYYRYLPSYASSNMAAEIITGKWLAGNRNVTQVDWDNLYEVNSLNSATSVYTLSDRVEKVRDLQGYAGASIKIDESTTIGLSLRARSDNVRRYRRMKDLLGGIAPEDIDQYLYEDEIYGDRTLNNVRQPNRKVNDGDVFGYDYDIRATTMEAILSAEYNNGGLSLAGRAGFGYTSFRREGKYEKEIYPGGLSYGPSGRISYENFSGEISARYGFTPMHSIFGDACAGRSPQAWGTHFITPMYSNETTCEPGSVTALRAEGGYYFRNRSVRASASVWYSSSRGRNELYNYWDDIASTYSAMHLKGLGEVSYGLEIAADFDLHPRWNLTAALALGSYKYSTDPETDIYSENTLQKYVSGATAYLKGYHTGTSPENIFNTRVSYNGKGISGSISANYLGGRYVMPSPLRRMQRAYNLALSNEALNGFIGQEKLGDAFTIDLNLLKSFRIKDGYLTFFLTVNNLLNNRGTVYNAYEQMRIGKRGSGVNTQWVPFGNKYLYTYGRTYYFSATWSF